MKKTQSNTQTNTTYCKEICIQAFALIISVAVFDYYFVQCVDFSGFRYYFSYKKRFCKLK